MAHDVTASPYGTFPATYRRARLSDVCVEDGGVQTGPFGSQLHQRDYVPFGTPIITVEHLGENRIIHRDLPRVCGEDRIRLFRYSLQPGDIVFSRVGSVDLRALVREEESGWLFSGRLLRVRPKPELVSPAYLSWFFGLPSFREYVRKIAFGATMPSLNTKLLSDLPVYFPSITEQRAIAHILGTLDNEIELNRRMNETLEAMARVIFKSWFVDFDPVRAKSEGGQPFDMDAATAALFPDSFQDSPLGEIPKGWQVGSLGDIAGNPRRGVLPGTVAPGTPYVGLEHMPRKSIALDQWGWATDVASNKFRFEQGEVLFGKLRPYFHKVGVAVQDGVCSTDILVIRAKSPAWFGIVLAYISSEEFVNYTSAVSTGTKMPRTNWQDMARYELVLPDSRAASAYGKFALRVVAMIRQNILQSRTLAALRDSLLPKLVSGGIRLKDAERFVGKIA